MTTHLTVPKAIFDNRRDAGRQLAAELKDLRGKLVVLAIPNGGVPVALEVASALKADLDVIICRKIPIPFTPEAGFGAIADDGTVVLNEELVRRLGLTEQQIEYEASRVRAEIKKRIMLYRQEQPLVTTTGKTVIIVDDGLASGYTMLAAIESVRRRQPKEIIAAVPVASIAAQLQIEKVADKAIACAIGTMPRFAVADFYRNWHDLNTDEVVRSLEKWRMERLRLR